MGRCEEHALPSGAHSRVGTLGTPARCPWGQASKAIACACTACLQGIVHENLPACLTCIRQHEAQAKWLGDAAGAVAAGQRQVQAAHQEAQGPARQRRLCGRQPQEGGSEQRTEPAGCRAARRRLAGPAPQRRALASVGLQPVCPPPPSRLKLKARSVRMRVREGLCSSGISCSQGEAAGRGGARGQGARLGARAAAGLSERGAAGRYASSTAPPALAPPILTPAPEPAALHAPTLAGGPRPQLCCIKALPHQQPVEVCTWGMQPGRGVFMLPGRAIRAPCA